MIEPEPEWNLLLYPYLVKYSPDVLKKKTKVLDTFYTHKCFITKTFNEWNSQDMDKKSHPKS